MLEGVREYEPGPTAIGCLSAVQDLLRSLDAAVSEGGVTEETRQRLMGMVWRTELPKALGIEPFEPEDGWRLFELVSSLKWVVEHAPERLSEFVEDEGGADMGATARPPPVA